jgi:hypothetical protein
MKPVFSVLPLLMTLAVGGMSILSLFRSLWNSVALNVMLTANKAPMTPVQETILEEISTARATCATTGGDHSANVYNGLYCSGDSLGRWINFGCGGTCHTVSDGWSVLLYQTTSGNPKPTADFFSDTGCKNKVLHAGIESGQVAGCTNSNSQFNSFYLYYNC